VHVARIALLVGFVVGCREQTSDRPVAIEAAPGAVHGVLSVPRPTPQGRSARRGWRCSGSGATRVCEDRALESDDFDCKPDGCTQRRPRMPDDGEWECADIQGVVICHGGGAAAGTVPGPADPAWICGARRGKPGERVCVDFSPDRPSRRELGDCRFDYEPERPLRFCRRGEPGLGRACSGAGCVAGSVCAGGHCLPLQPKPECWLDADCGRGVCALGSCRAEGR
jgi:hypothetical protein